MIRTNQKHIPWIWVIALLSTTAIFGFIDKCSGAVLTFTLRKFTEDPALIAFVGSINIAFNFLVAPYVSYKSDRIWTRWGRRKPFMISGFLLLAIALFAVPFAPSLLVLGALVIVWQFAADWGYTGPWSPLLYETVPTSQRGRMVVIKSLIGWPLMLFFNLVLIGQFDNTYQFPHIGMSITGEQVIYILAGFLALLVVANLVLFVRETKPENQHADSKFHPFAYFKEVFGERQFRLIYLLLVVGVFMNAGMGQLGPLLYTEQWGYSKQEYGYLMTVQMVATLCIVTPIVYFIIDRFDRFHIFLVMLAIGTLHPLVYWGFIKFIAPDQIPSIGWIIFFMVFSGIEHSAASLALEPFFFDVTPRNKMGAMNSGFLLVRGVMLFIINNAVAWWIKGYSAIFSPGKIDYTSGFLWMALLGFIGLIGGLYFESQRRKGNVIMYGQLEQEQDKAEASR